MLNDLYTFSVPVFLRGHSVLSELLRKGEAHAAGYNITPSALLTFEELYARIQRTSEFVEKFQADAFRDAELRKIELNMSAGVVSLTAEKYLTRFALPNFYFHVTTAYDILRHNGVTLGKRDYLGELSQG